MKNFLIVLLCSILILSGCANQQQSTPTIPQKSPETVPVTEVEIDIEESTEPNITEEKNYLHCSAYAAIDAKRGNCGQNYP